MARAGGYGRKKSDEYIGTTEAGYAEAITSAQAMGLTIEAWTLDAIRFHAYRCEEARLASQYEADELKARAELQPTPDRARYKPVRPAPVMSEPGSGKGGPAGKGYNYRS